MSRVHTPRQGETIEQCRERIIRRRKLYTLVFLAGIIGLIVVMSYTVFFPMTNFEVIGVTRYEKNVLEAAAKLPARTQLLGLATERVREELIAELPYLESVSVQRRLPNTLTVTVSDAKTVLAIKLNKSYLILSGKGKVLEITEKVPENALPFTIEPPYEAPVGGEVVFYADKEKDNWTREVFDAFVLAFENCGYSSYITSLDMSDPYLPSMVYQDRITLCLGSRDSFLTQLKFALRTIRALDKEDKEKQRKPSRGTLKLDVDNQSFFTKE